jgi:hypothetical protein
MGMSSFSILLRLSLDYEAKGSRKQETEALVKCRAFENVIDVWEERVIRALGRNFLYVVMRNSATGEVRDVSGGHNWTEMTSGQAHSTSRLHPQADSG